MGCATYRAASASSRATRRSWRGALRAGDLRQRHAQPRLGLSFLAGEDKWSLLGRSKLVLNVHREDFPPYFEWVRVLEAIHCGAVVVSERSWHFAPLVAGTHFSPAPREPRALADELLDSPERLERIARRRLRIRPRAAAAARARPRARRGRRSDRGAAARGRRACSEARPACDHAAGRSRARTVLRRPLDRTPAASRAGGAGAKQSRLETIALSRRIAELERAARGRVDPPETVVRHQSPAFGAAAPRVSVIVPALYNHAGAARPALDSVAAGEYATSS